MSFRRTKDSRQVSREWLSYELQTDPRQQTGIGPGLCVHQPNNHVLWSLNPGYRTLYVIITCNGTVEVGVILMWRVEGAPDPCDGGPEEDMATVSPPPSPHERKKKE